MTNPTQVYYGQREDMVAEVAAFDPRQAGVSSKECKYLIMPMGDAQFDTEYVSNRKAARELAQYIASQYAGCMVCAL